MNNQGSGLWYVRTILDCNDELPRFVSNATIDKHKLNRTHDLYDLEFDVYETVGNTYGVLINFYKHSDGGSRLIQVMAENNIEKFVEKYAPNNAKVAFTKAGIDPPGFPIKAGSYKIEDFFFNHCELPDMAIYGEYTVDAFIVKDDIRVACFRGHVDFREDEDDICNRTSSTAERIGTLKTLY
ncbi:unnamed protein product [Pieris brassicae]|uniref:Uncharacterized protein n=1 Tax=Pieris brassicae TaxID=7116 RepID=A0A9P0T527_PIEBR|nr:unnamed protein product [Pieris brassicae]